VHVERMARRLVPVLRRFDPESAAQLLVVETMAALAAARVKGAAR